LGQKLARGSELADFLDQQRPEYLYLVGDMIDGWCLRWRWHWPESYGRIVQRLIDLVGAGTAVRYAPGNHDAFLRRAAPRIPGVEIADEFVHLTADGRRLLVVHGDLFDSIERHSRWLSRLGSFGYNRIIDGNLICNYLLRLCGARPVYFAFSIKRASKQLLGAFGRFQATLIHVARERGMDGIVCGHVHFPQVRGLGDQLYVNTGDWLENASALLERADGTLELWNHGRVVERVPPRQA
jgi:UDP-2,3-diacylglucosamine pyrophosphatase LpxH